MGRLRDNREGNRLRSKYLAKVVRSVSTDGFLFAYTCLCVHRFIFLLVYWKNGRTSCWLTQPNSYQWRGDRSVDRIEMFAERKRAECEDITKFAGSSEKDLILLSYRMVEER